RELMVFLHSHGVSGARASRVYKEYGDRAIELVRENPYRLADDIRGIGFHTADELARSLGIPEDSPFRIRAAVRHALGELAAHGHVGFPVAGLMVQVGRLVPTGAAAIAAALEAEVAAKAVVRERRRGEELVFLAGLHAAEVGLAAAVRRIAAAKRHPFPVQIDLPKRLEFVEKQLGVQLAHAQREAVFAACRHPLVIVTGGPGVGKTTLVRCLLSLYQSEGLPCVQCAPTGRAAKRMTEASGQPAVTMHRLLEFDPSSGEFLRNAENPLRGALFVLDEASMVDCALGWRFFAAVPAGAAVVVVGDVDQLPSVGPGAVLGDLIAGEVAPVVRLTHIFRQGAGSRIVAAAHAINRGELPEPTPSESLSDFYFIEAAEPAEIERVLLRLVCERIPERFGFDPRRDVQVLSPMRRGRLGVRNLNELLQNALNPRPAARLERMGIEYRVGDRVLQTENNYEREVFNGDLGVVRRIDEEDQVVFVGFEGREVPYALADLEELTLAYCMTIHKSQGSEYPCVVMALHTQHFVLLERNLVYTGVTRGKRLVVLVGDRRALSLAVARREARLRCTALQDRLRGDSG
ncbi:MAG TPA: ATP-dependent RecD-like DNA helicase, partial [Planctomycetia bacterium]|nr:ATP-dependent RecD-like DNA helicase [Planctomycetia bacterium]